MCKKKCLINNCQEVCNLPFDHDGRCDCRNPHKCINECSLFKLSLKDTCKGKCKLKYGHEEECICEISPNKHKCNKACSKEQCSKPCKLEANHFQKNHKNCFCGQCKCGKNECQYINISQNCKYICVKDLYHEGPHLCEEKEHLCNEDCDYKKITRSNNGGCLKKCKFPVGHEGEHHFCSNKKEKHKCAKKCSLENVSIPGSCEIFCDKSIDHQPPCICCNEPNKHKCKLECEYSKNKNVRECKTCKS